MNIKIWNKLTKNQQLAIFRQGKFNLLEKNRMDKYYPRLNQLFENNEEIKIVKCYRGGYKYE